MRIVVSDFQPAILEPEFKRLLGVPANYEYSGPMAELREWVEKWFRQHGRPWIYARLVPIVSIETEGVQLEGYRIRSTEFRKRMLRNRATFAVIAAVSAGAEAEDEAGRLWDESYPDRYYFLEVYASAMVEALIETVRQQVCDWGHGSRLSVLPHYSPGYHGWALEDQAELLHLALAGGDKLPAALEVLESGMLRPKKSQLAVFGLTAEKIAQNDEVAPCQTCAAVRCQYRREPWRLEPRFPLELEEVQ